jgi:cytidylate kinase
MARLTVTIDGPAASGKSTVAAALAAKLGASCLDTGAMYRAATLAALRAGIDPANERGVLGVLEKSAIEFIERRGANRVLLDGQDVTGDIRTPRVTAGAKYLAASSAVRRRLVRAQRDYAAGREMIVSEGRDQGTVVFPGAEVKVYLTADAAARAGRRHAELAAKGTRESLEKILRDIEERDRTDSDRRVAPMKPAPDAVVIDTTGLTVEQVVERVFEMVKNKCPERS